MSQRTIIKILTWHRSKRILFIAAFLILLIPLTVAGACSSTSPTPSIEPSITTQPLTPTATTPLPLTTSAPTTSSSTTAGDFADQGSKIYTIGCSACHGNNGQGGSGPAIIGSKTNLANYKTGKGLLDYIATAMPPEAPGSLSAQQAQQVAAFILVQNNLLSRGTTWDPNQLSNVVIK